ncbi:TolC family protein [Nostoc sp. FACHB-87]|uniref:TolC family protein n=1 Tax=Nostocaceae TaxID=1162 RepID=UPI001683681D|nr:MULTISPECIES: TolC family protein [Nostocaceae]MBD2457517.1 TolC family protein [Nostoc sp. FACHB-87]MBD2478489.1 TolC family protein [Anabaena sp. FACHB-83]
MLSSVHSTWFVVAIALLISAVPKSVDAQTSPQTTPQIPAENLNPSANPLQFPTKPEEVQIQKTVPLSLTQALELARRNNRNLQVTILELERSRAALRESQASLFPSLDINGNVTNSGNGFSSNSSQPSTSFNGTAQLNYDLYTSGNRQAVIKEDEEQLRIDELDVENQSREIELNVKTQYYNLQQADEQVRINQSAVANAQASLQDAQARERAGVGTRFDVLQAQVNLANAQQDLTNSLSDQQIARRQLGTLLSLPQSVDITAADAVALAGLWQPTLEQSIVEAFQNRPELRQQIAQRNISEQQRRQAIAQVRPQVSLVTSYNLLDRFNDTASVTDGYSIGLQASMNLFDGGAAKARAAQAKTNIAIAETQFANQRDQIRFNVEQYYTQLRSNLDNVQTSAVGLEQAREALNIARIRYQAGVGTQTEVIEAENDLTRAEGNRVTAILNYNRALANLQRAVSARASR